MITAIFNFVSALVGGIFDLVGGILVFALGLPLWFILAQNLIGLGIIAGIIVLITRKAARK